MSARTRHSQRFRVAVVQMDSRDNVAANLLQAQTLIAQAARRRAELVLLPEHALYIGPDPHRRFDLRAPEVRALAEGARNHQLWLLVGAVQEAVAGTRGHYNTALLFGPDGRLHARYRKIHLFRCRMPGGRWLRETGSRPGHQIVVAKTPFGKLGLTICYDVRMPELFGQLVARGAQLLAVPSNFTAYTGRQHWHTLLRTRAIENQAFVFAPAQCGRKYHTPSYGHSLIIDPWGKVMAEASADRPAVLVKTIDLSIVAEYRKRLPALRDRMLRGLRSVSVKTTVPWPPAFRPQNL